MVAKLNRTAALLRGAIREPSDVGWLIRIALFIVRAPRDLANTDLATFVERLRNGPRPKANDLTAGTERIKRLRGACLRMPALWRRDSCYVRALTLYRFLDPGQREVRLHFGVELPEAGQQRLHGHAWVTADRAILEGPDAVLAGRIRELARRG
jgi:hypothetical protein